MEIGIGVGIGVALGVVGFLLGRSGARSAGVREGRAEAGQRLAAAAESIRRGRRPQVEAGSPEEELYVALEQGWAPRETERQAALKEAIGRVSAFLDASVRVPLAGAGREARAGELRERIERALGALEDLNFFLEEPTGESEGRDLVPLVQHVAREFAADQDVGVRIQLAEASVSACRIWAGAVSGEPAVNGGSGAYSIMSWMRCATASPAISAAMVNPKSIPAVTPPPVNKFPSRTTRPSVSTAPSGASRSRDIQCVVARLPCSNPAAPSTSEPVHTEVT